MITAAERRARFRALHEDRRTFVIANPWDAGSARLLTTFGFPALATTSAGLGFALGRQDSAACLTRDQVLDNAREIVDATPLPVSADLEAGFGDAPEVCAETIRLAFEVGLAGGSIEDATGDPGNPIYAFDHAVTRVAAACAAKPAPDFMVTARAENYLNGRPDLDDTIRRLQAFEAGGADVLFAPGLPDIAAIRAVCAAVTKPVNVVMGLREPFYSVATLAEAGVTRVSVGGAMARAALGAVIRAAQEVRDHGTFGFATEAASGAEINALLAGPPGV